MTGNVLAATATLKGVYPDLLTDVTADPSLPYLRTNYGPGTDVCEYLYSFKVDLAEGAFTEGVPVTYTAGSGDVETVKEPGSPDAPFSVTIVKTGDNNFNFYSASQPVFHVWVKGGPNGYLFPYWNPAGTPHFPAGAVYDSGLYSPMPGWSHITFYYCGGREELTVSKTAVTSYTRTHLWDIDKRVETENHDTEQGHPKIWLYEGAAGESATWYVDVAYDGYEDDGYAVSGTITVANTGGRSAVITGVSDVLGGVSISPAFPETFPYTLAPGETLVGTYSEIGYFSGDNVVTVTTAVDTYSGTKAIVWGAPASVVNETVHVNDSVKGTLGTLTAPNGDTFTYSEDFEWAMYGEAGGGHHEYDNTATISETGQSASAKLLVNVLYEDLNVTKTVETSYTRTHSWDIDKRVDTENGHTVDEDTPKIWLYTDGSGDETATWYVDVTYEGYEDSDFAIGGTVTVENTGSQDAVISSVADLLAGTPVDVTWSVPVTIPYTLAVGDTLEGTYGGVTGCRIEGSNTVTVSTLLDAYLATEPIVWGEPEDSTNETVHIKDLSDLFGEVDLGAVTAPHGDTFTYDEYFDYAGYSDRGEHQAYDNTASIVETGQYATALLRVNAQQLRYETAYAKGDEEAEDVVCFAPTFKKWGWTNQILPGTYTWDLWAGAAQCDTAKGTIVGTVAVVYDPTTYDVAVTFNMLPGCVLEEEHVHAGSTQYPQVRQGKKYVSSVAPGQYTNNGPFDGNPVWVIVHGVVGLPDPTFGPSE